ncbi:hypothetical protein HBB16_09260 [Pseudonocardia sp. MCCB 268]|nr:hypothetical protein [Pseudonocardia cytotoxica]
MAAPAYYPNCGAARDAGAAPLHRGDPGCSKLDRDDDSVACSDRRPAVAVRRHGTTPAKPRRIDRRCRGRGRVVEFLAGPGPGGHSRCGERAGAPRRVRISDADRKAVADRLRAPRATSYLDLAEVRRAGHRGLADAHRGDLARVTRDLPAPRTPRPDGLLFAASSGVAMRVLSIIWLCVTAATAADERHRPADRRPPVVVPGGRRTARGGAAGAVAGRGRPPPAAGPVTAARAVGPRRPMPHRVTPAGRGTAGAGVRSDRIGSDHGTPRGLLAGAARCL